MAEYGPNFSLYTKIKPGPLLKDKRRENPVDNNFYEQNQVPKVSKINQETIPKQVMIDKEEEIRRRDETIKVLQAKVSKLEQLLQLKELRIEDLSSRLKNIKGVHVT